MLKSKKYILSLFLLFISINTIGEISQNNTKPHVELLHSLVYTINMDNSSNVDCSLSITTDNPIQESGFEFDWIVRNFKNNSIENPYMYLENEKVEFKPIIIDTVQYGDGSYGHIYRTKIIPVNLQKGNLLFLKYSYKIPEAITYQQHSYTTILPLYTYNKQFTLNSTDIELTIKKKIQVDLPFDEYHWAKLGHTTIPPNYIYTQNKATSAVWEFESENPDPFIIYFTIHEANLEKELNKATINSERLGKIALILGLLSLFLAILPIIIQYIKIKK